MSKFLKRLERHKRKLAESKQLNSYANASERVKRQHIHKESKKPIHRRSAEEQKLYQQLQQEYNDRQRLIVEMRMRAEAEQLRKELDELFK